jgi:hypothetical protein
VTAAPTCGMTLAADPEGNLWLHCATHGLVAAVGPRPSVEVVAQAAGGHAAQVEQEAAR